MCYEMEGKKEERGFMMGSHEKKRAKKRQQKQREFLNDLGLFGDKNE